MDGDVTMTKTEIDEFMRACCTTDAGMYVLDAPWSIGGWKYATNRRIAARIATDDPDTIDDRKRMPEMATMPWPVAGSDGWVSLPKYVEAPPTKTVQCVLCTGTGTASCPHCDQDIDCDVCDGSGAITEEPEWRLTLFGISFNMRDIHQLWTLPDVEIRRHNDEVVQWRSLSTGIDGLIIGRATEQTT